MDRLIPVFLISGVLGIGLIVWAAIYGANLEYDVPEGTEVFDLVEGTWAWTTTDEGCADQPQGITFSPDHEQMFIAWLEKAADSTGTRKRRSTYDIVEHSQSHIRGAIIGEERLTAAGEPVVWDLVLLSEDAFRWHRTDWADFRYTASLRRCPEP